MRNLHLMMLLMAIVGGTARAQETTGTITGVLTDSSGGYQFAGLTAGAYHVRQSAQPGWSWTSPAGGVYSISLASAQSLSDRNFGNKR